MAKGVLCILHDLSQLMGVSAISYELEPKKTLSRSVYNTMLACLSVEANSWKSVKGGEADSLRTKFMALRYQFAMLKELVLVGLPGVWFAQVSAVSTSPQVAAPVARPQPLPRQQQQQQYQKQHEHQNNQRQQPHSIPQPSVIPVHAAQQTPPAKTEKKKKEKKSKQQDQQASVLAPAPAQDPYPFDGGSGDAILAQLAKDAGLTPQVGEEKQPIIRPEKSKKPEKVHLPVMDHKDKILGHVENNIVTCISGETGCGKSSGIPHMLFEDAQQNNKRVSIVITQPRRIAAITLAQRVAQQLGSSVGDLVGYCIGGEKKSTQNTKILFVTTGYLLQLLSHNHSAINKFTHIIIDEAHERSVDGDLLSLVIKKVIGAFKENKRLIVMSATLQSSLFAQYFAALGADPEHVPEVIHVGGKRYPVEEVFLEDFTKYAAGLPAPVLQQAVQSFNKSIVAQGGKGQLFTESTTKGVVGKDGKIRSTLSLRNGKVDKRSIQAEITNFMQSPEPTLVFSSDLGADERKIIHGLAHKWDLKSKSHGKQGVDRHIVLTKKAGQSNKLQSAVRAQAKSQDKLHHMKADIPPEIMQLTTKLVCSLADQCIGQDWSILVFLPGQGEIFNLLDELEVMRQLHVIVLHSAVPQADQTEAFEPAPLGKIKVVLSTNIAESSVTIPDVRFVVNLGLRRMMQMDTQTRVLALVRGWCSRASGRQRAGRAGRLFPGTCFHLMTRPFHEKCLADFDPPEMLEMPLENVVLQVRILLSTFGTVTELLSATPQPPHISHINVALSRLAEVGALSSHEEDSDVTSFGQLAVHLPIEVNISKLVVYGLLFGCECDAVVMAAATSVQDVFSMPSSMFIKNPQQFGKALKISFANRVKHDRGQYSEILGVRNAYIGWLQAHKSFDYLRQNSISRPRMKQLDQTVIDIASHLIKHLGKIPGSKWRFDKLQVLGGRNASSATDSCFAKDPIKLQFIACMAFAPVFSVGSRSRQSDVMVKTLKKAGLDPTRSMVLQGVPPDLQNQQEVFSTIERGGAGSPDIVRFDGDPLQRKRSCFVQFPWRRQDQYKSPVLDDVPVDARMMFQLTEGRSQRGLIMSRSGGPSDGEWHFGGVGMPYQLKWTSLSNTNVNFLANWRSPLYSCCDVKAGIDDMSYMVAASLIGTENPKNMRIVGGTIMPKLGRFTPLSLFMSLAPSTDVSVLVDFDKKVVKAFRVDEGPVIVFFPVVTVSDLEICNAIRSIVSHTLVRMDTDCREGQRLFDSFIKICTQRQPGGQQQGGDKKKKKPAWMWNRVSADIGDWALLPEIDCFVESDEEDDDLPDEPEDYDSEDSDLDDNLASMVIQQAESANEDPIGGYPDELSLLEGGYGLD